MTLRGVFIRADGALRTPWRVVGFLVVAILATAVLTPVIFGIVRPVATASGYSPTIILQLVQSTAFSAGLLVAHAVMLRVVDKRPWSDAWLGREAARPALLGRGFLIGMAAIALPTLLLLAVGWLSPVPGRATGWAAATLRVSVFLLPAALMEELLTRGYLLSVLREALGWRVAIVATSVAFGLLHLANNDVTAGSILMVILAGIFLGVVVLATRSLYAAWMAHFAWNFTMAVLFHTAVSGFWFETPKYRVVDAGPDWVTGGPWGPEGGVPAGLGMLSGLTYLYARRLRREER